MICFGVIFHMFCALEFIQLLCGFIVFIKFQKFSVIISSGVFSVHPPPFRDSNFTYIKLLEVVSQLNDALFIIFVSFSQCVSFWISLYCYVFSAQIFPSVTFNLLLPSLSVIFIVHKVFISRGILSMCLLVFLNIWNNCNCFSVFVYSTIYQFWLANDSSSYLSCFPTFVHA